MAAERDRNVTYANLSASGQARFHAGDNYNRDYTYNYTVRQKRSDETLRASDKHRRFIQAVVEGQVPRVLNFLRMRVDLDETGSSDLTALHRAILSGHQGLLLEPLIEAGADVNAVSVDFGTPLCLAALKGMDEAVKLLLQSKAKASMITEKLGSALHCCVLSAGDHKDTAVALIGAGADVSTQVRIDTRWLHAICSWDGDDRTPIGRPDEFNGCILSDATSALIAIRSQQEGLLELLLPSDLDQNFTAEFVAIKSKKSSAQSDPLVRPLQRGTFEPTTASSEHTYLGSCATLGLLESAKLLLARRASLECTYERSSPLHLAVRHGYIEIVELLVREGAPIGNDWTALHEAAHASNPGIIRMLCKNGASVDVRTSDGDRPIHLAALLFSKTFDDAKLHPHRALLRSQQEHIHARADAYLHSLQALIDAGADVNARDGRGRTPLLLALQAGSILAHPHSTSYMEPDKQWEEAIVQKALTHPLKILFLEKLVQAGADTRVRAADGTSVLKLVTANTTTQPIFKALVQGKRFEETLINRMYFTIRSCEGFKPKHLLEVELNNICAKKGHEHLRLLTLLGGNLDADGSCGWTALHCAAQEDDCIVIDRLLAAGAMLGPPTDFLTPLAVAVREKRLEAVRMLLDRGADPYEHKPTFQSAMEIALRDNDSGILNLVQKAAESIPTPIFEHSDSSENQSQDVGPQSKLMAYHLKRERAFQEEERARSIWYRPSQVTTSDSFSALYDPAGYWEITSSSTRY